MDGGETMSIGVGIFLMVLGAILAFAIETDVPGINVNTLGVILMVTGAVVVLYSLLFWSSLTPWGRRRVAARRRMVGLEEEPVELIEERPPPLHACLPSLGDPPRHTPALPPRDPDDADGEAAVVAGPGSPAASAQPKRSSGSAALGTPWESGVKQGRAHRAT